MQPPGSVKPHQLVHRHLSLEQDLFSSLECSPRQTGALEVSWSLHHPAKCSRITSSTGMLILQGWLAVTCLRRRLFSRSTTRTCWERKSATGVVQLNEFQLISDCPFYLLQWQLGELGQRTGQQANDEGRRGADNVQHCRWQNGDVRVLPYEGVKQCHGSVAALRESAGTQEVCTGKEHGPWMDRSVLFLNNERDTYSHHKRALQYKIPINQCNRFLQQ